MLFGVKLSHESGANSIEHGGTCPRFYQWLSMGGASGVAGGSCPPLPYALPPAVPQSSWEKNICAL